MYKAENEGKGKDKEKKEEINCSVCFYNIYFNVHEDFEYLYMCALCDWRSEEGTVCVAYACSYQTGQ